MIRLLGYLQPVLGLHVGIGPCSAVSGVATTAYAHAKPTIRTTILTARFMVCFSLSADPLGAGTLTATNYTRRVKQARLVENVKETTTLSHIGKNRV